MKKSKVSQKLPKSSCQQYKYTQEEIGTLEPTTKLVEYYRKWIADFENDRKKLQSELDRLIMAKSHLVCEVERDDLLRQLTEFMQEMSDLKINFHSEQRQSLQLLQSNESLKADVLLLKQKLTLLQGITEIPDEELESYCKNTKISKLLKSKYKFKLKAIKQQLSQFSESSVNDTAEVNSLKGKLMLLKDENEKQKKLFINEIETLREAKSLCSAEVRTILEENQARTRLLSTKLDHAEEKLVQQQRKINNLVFEKQKIQEQKLSEIDRMFSSANKPKEFMSSEANKENVELYQTMNSEGCIVVLKRQLANLKNKLEEEVELRSLYENRCNKFDQRLCKLKEEKETLIENYQIKLKRYEEKLQLSEKQKSRLTVWKRKQFEGFSSDLEILKSQLKKVVQQLYKITNFFSNYSKEIPSEKLEELKGTSSLVRTIHLTLVETRKRMMQLEVKSSAVK